MKSFSNLVLAACVLALSLVFLPAPAFAAAAYNGLNFNILSFRTEGIAMAATSGDMNGDGQIDFLLFHKPSKESRDKFCSIYLQNDNTFKTTPDYDVHLGEHVGAVTVDDIDSDGKAEMAAFAGEGAVLVKLTGSHTTSTRGILSYQSLLPVLSRQLTPVNWVSDLNGDGRKDILVPVSNGFQLFLQNENGDFVEDRLFPFPVSGSFRSEGDEQYVSYRIPKIDFKDYDGDGRTDLGIFDLERVDYFLSNNSPGLQRHKSSPLLQKFSKDFMGASTFGDLNDDGIPDAVLILMSQKKNLESEVQIYFGSGDFTYPSSADQTYSADSSLVFPVFLDATGDGKQEMLLHDINVGIGFFISYFLRNRIRVDTTLRKIGPDGKYEEPPLIKRAIYIEASNSGAEPARAAGDFNGDGLDDFVVGTTENRLSFFLSNRTEILPRDPSENFDVPAYGDMAVLKMNDDNRADLVILYSQEDKENLAVLFVSR